MNTGLSAKDRKHGVKKTVVVLVLFMLLLLGLLVNRILQPRILSPKEMVSNGAIMFSVPREISPIHFTDQNQQPFLKQQFKNKWTFVFFGFTHCPDICPTTLALFNKVANSLQDSEFVKDTQFLFVTLDPARDKPENIKPYIEYFNPKFIGVTGEFLELHRFANELNVGFQKVVTNSETGDYSIDHGGNVALINPQGHYHGLYKPPLNADKMTVTYQSLRMQQQ